MKRYECMGLLCPKLPEDLIVVTGVANTARQLYELRPSEANVYGINLGSCTAVALGLAKALPHRRVLALDGDGNLLLGLVALADAANQRPKNLGIIVFDNQCYEAPGGCPTATAGLADLAAIAKGCGISNSQTVRDLESFEAAVEQVLKAQELTFVCAKVQKESEYIPGSHEPDDGRANTLAFARYIERTEGLQVTKQPFMHRQEYEERRRAAK